MFAMMETKDDDGGRESFGSLVNAATRVLAYSCWIVPMSRGTQPGAKTLLEKG